MSERKKDRQTYFRKIAKIRKKVDDAEKIKCKHPIRQNENK